jgi:hypothetical protein
MQCTKMERSSIKINCQVLIIGRRGFMLNLKILKGHNESHALLTNPVKIHFSAVSRGTPQVLR